MFDSKAAKIILGMQFLQENDAIINIKESYISLDNIEYEIELNNNIIDDNETVIHKKLKIFLATETTPMKNELITKMIIKNPELVHITGIKYEIELSKDFF